MVERETGRRGAGVISVSYCEVCPALSVGLTCVLLHVSVSVVSSRLFMGNSPAGARFWEKFLIGMSTIVHLPCS